MPVYAGASGVSRQIKTVPVGVSGVNRNCKNIWAGVNGVNRQVFAAGTPIISACSVGDTVKITENGKAVEFIIVGTNYPVSGRILVLRKDIYDLRPWNASSTAYASSSIDSWLNSTYLNLIESGVRAQIAEVPIEVSDHVEANRKVFLLSNRELDQNDHTYTPALGSSLEYFREDITTTQMNIRRRAYYNGTLTRWWTRNRNTGSGNAFYVNTSDNYDPRNAAPSTNYGSRPAFTLPSTILVDEENNVLG